MSFQQKRALVSLIALGIAAAWYAANAWRSPPASPLGALPMLVAAAVGLTVMMIAAHIVLAIGAGAEETRRRADDAGRLVRAAAWRNAAWVMATGLFLVVVLGLILAPPVIMLQAAAAAFVLAEMVRYGSELALGRAAPSLSPSV